MLNEFTRDLPVDLRPVLPGFASHGNHTVESWALGNESIVVLYVVNVVDHGQAVEPGQLSLWTRPGTFDVCWIEPATGETVHEERISTDQQITRLSVPPVRVDLAAKLIRVVG